MTQSSVLPVTLIVGSDSVVGGALFGHLVRAGERVIGTSRRGADLDQFHWYLDLSQGSESWRFPWPVSVAVICAGITKLEACRREPVASARVNVKATVALAEKLAAQGAFVIYLSTNQVFDGSQPYRKPDDAMSPATEYGRQKAEAERRIGKLGNSVAIVRFTKILELRPLLFSTWIEVLRETKPIQPFSDMFMAPVPLACAISVLRLVADRRMSGIIQVSGGIDTTYAEAAAIGARLIDADEGLIQPIRACESGFYSEPVPAHTTLNIDRLKSSLGVEPPDVRWTIQAAFAAVLAEQR